MLESLQSGRYRIVRKLGEGGMGMVFEAEDATLGRAVAVKLIRSTGIDQQALQRFQREAQATARLSHPNIVTIYDVGEEDGRHYLVLEYVEGQSLGEYLKNQPDGRCDPYTALSIASQICKALQHAHQRGILHRDIKPANVLMTNEGQAKLVDFGIAKALGMSQLTQDGAALGTPAYLPPEQIQGQGSDTRSDLYSLGCVLFEMLTGEPPFSGDDLAQLLYSHIYVPPPMPRQIAGEIPLSLEQITIKLLAKDPAERYQSSRELLDALNAARAVISNHLPLSLLVIQQVCRVVQNE